MSKESLKKGYDKACNDYVIALAKMWDIHSGGNFWVGDEVGGTFCFDDLFINMNDIVFCVDNDVSIEEYEEWQNYCVWASDFNITSPNFESFYKGCPIVPEDEMRMLSNRKRELEMLIEETKDKVSNNSF